MSHKFLKRKYIFTQRYPSGMTDLNNEVYTSLKVRYRCWWKLSVSLFLPPMFLIESAVVATGAETSITTSHGCVVLFCGLLTTNTKRLKKPLCFFKRE